MFIDFNNSEPVLEEVDDSRIDWKEVLCKELIDAVMDRVKQLNHMIQMMKRVLNSPM